ncbi:hypothetical protein [Brevundimonas aurifodinae]|uniref:Uncharacterized protein n=1 Tax=Brevundimonas aurifodinae TaxID=1508312 RepID=A0ABV1NRM5_9CAUL
MSLRRLAALRDVLARFAEALDRRPEDDLRDDLDGLARRIERLEARNVDAASEQGAGA